MENGPRSEKKESMPDLGDDTSSKVCVPWEDRRERKVRKTLVRMKAPAIITRGGRMVGNAEGLYAQYSTVYVQVSALEAVDCRRKSHPRMYREYVVGSVQNPTSARVKQVKSCCTLEAKRETRRSLLVSVTHASQRPRPDSGAESTGAKPNKLMGGLYPISSPRLM